MPLEIDSKAHSKWLSWLPSDERKTSLMSVKNATMHEKRTIAQNFAENWLKFRTPTCRAVFPAKFKVFKLFSEPIDSSLQVVNIRARVNDDSSFRWHFRTGTFSQVAAQASQAHV